MSDSKPIELKIIKAPEFFSSEAYEYQYVPFKNELGEFVAISFFKTNAETDLNPSEIKIELAKKALCTITLPLDLARQLGSNLAELN